MISNVVPYKLTRFIYITAATVDMTQSGSQYQPQEKGKPPKGDSFDAPWQDPNCPKGKYIVVVVAIRFIRI